VKTTGIVSGQVYNAETITAIPFCTVQLSNRTVQYEIQCNYDGTFIIDGIPFDDYTIKISNNLYYGIEQNITVEIEDTHVVLVGIPQNIVADIRNGWVTQEQLNEVVTNTEAAKDDVIAQRDQTITNLNTTIASMFTQQQLDQAVLDERMKYDQNGDGVIGMDNVIYYLQILSGLRPH
jgi:hypothetical protein